MTNRELIKKATHIYYAGMCECGETKYDLDCGDGLAYEPIHEGMIKQVRPELLKEVEKYEN